MRTIQDHSNALNALRVNLSQSETPKDETPKPRTSRAAKPKGGGLRRSS